MTTTAVYQKKPDFYESQEKCVKSIKNTIQTNIRYKNFNQTHFTAGDEEQFQRFRNTVNGNICPPNISLKKNIFRNEGTEKFKKYNDIKATTVLNTFRYIFDKFKKGIFVKILDNKLSVFLPFSKFNFQNEWEHKIKVDPKFKNINNFLEIITKRSGYKFNKNFVNRNINQWYSNNCILRYDVDKFKLPSEGDTNVCVIKNMLEELCANRQVPDIEFFINRRDFPILTTDNTEPYNNIWDGFIPLKSHNYDKYSPILSMSKTNKYADILIPTYEDWSRIQSKNNIWFPKACSNFEEDFPTKWEDKIPVAIFRGSSTGCGINIKTNKRLKLAFISKNIPKGKEKLLDAGITKWNLRPRKIEGYKFLQTIDKDNINIEKVKKLSLKEQSRYKYIINVEGHVAAFRLSKELNTGSVILLVKSKWKIWYSDMLKPYEHYIPIKEDLSDIFSQIEWCKNHDSKCKIIAENAKKFYNLYLCKEGVLDFLQKTLVGLKKQIGIYLYNVKTPLEIQINYERKNINYTYPTTTKTCKDITNIPYINRSYGLLQGISWIINMIISNKVNIKKGKIVFKNKLSSIYDYSIAGFNTIIKSSTDKKKIKEHIHENFIGNKVINNLVKIIPNFAYIFNIYKDDNHANLIVEKISGQTLHEYIESDSFSFSEFLTILMQICLALQVAQNFCGFIHYDLTPWNIILQRLDNTTKVDYIISNNKVVSIETKVIPVIFDYGKSHVIYNDKHFGFINMFKISKIQDVLTILLTSMYPIITKKNLNKHEEWPNYFKLINFISNTKYCPTKFRKSFDVKNFLRKAKRYSYLIANEKYELESRTPYDLFQHIFNIKKYYKNFKVTINKNYNSMNWLKMDKANSKQVFDFILSKTKEEKIKSYLNVFKNVSNCELPKSTNNIYNYYSVQKIKQNLLSVKNQMVSYLNYNNIKNDPCIALYNQLISDINIFYKGLIKEHEFYSYSILENNEIFHYDENTFLLPQKILEFLKQAQTKNDNFLFLKQSIAEIREIILYILCYRGPFQLPQKDRDFIVQDFQKVLSNSYLDILINNTNLKTLLSVSGKIYKENYKQILDNKQNCDKIKNYRKLYKNIFTNIIDINK